MRLPHSAEQSVSRIFGSTLENHSLEHDPEGQEGILELVVRSVNPHHESFKELLLERFVMRRGFPHSPPPVAAASRTLLPRWRRRGLPACPPSRTLLPRWRRGRRVREAGRVGGGHVLLIGGGGEPPPVAADRIWLAPSTRVDFWICRRGSIFGYGWHRRGSDMVGGGSILDRCSPRMEISEGLFFWRKARSDCGAGWLRAGYGWRRSADRF